MVYLFGAFRGINLETIANQITIFIYSEDYTRENEMKRLTREHLIPLNARYKVFEPAIEINAGETIVVETINHMSPIVYSEKNLHPHGSPEYEERRETGPISVRGAEPGGCLAIRIDDIKIVGLPHAHGGGPLKKELPQEPLGFPVKEGRCLFPGDLSIPVTPMVGDIYTTPASPNPPYYDHGGNMDFTEVRPGNTLFLPIYRSGGLLVLGDVHAVQGNGEIYGEAAECAAEVTITIDIDRIYNSPRPLVETSDVLISLAGRGSLFESIQLVLEDTTKLVSRLYKVKEEEAYIFCAVVGSLRLGGCVAEQAFIQQDCRVGLSIPKDIKPGTYAYH